MHPFGGPIQRIYRSPKPHGNAEFENRLEECKEIENIPSFVEHDSFGIQVMYSP